MRTGTRTGTRRLRRPQQESEEGKAGDSIKLPQRTAALNKDESIPESSASTQPAVVPVVVSPPVVSLATIMAAANTRSCSSECPIDDSLLAPARVFEEEDERYKDIDEGEGSEDGSPPPDDGDGDGCGTHKHRPLSVFQRTCKSLRRISKVRESLVRIKGRHYQFDWQQTAVLIETQHPFADDESDAHEPALVPDDPMTRLRVLAEFTRRHVEETARINQQLASSNET